MIPEPANRQRSHSLDHDAMEIEGSFSPSRKTPGHVRTNFLKAVYNPPSPTPQQMIANGIRHQQNQHRSTSPIRMFPHVRSASPLRSSSPMRISSPLRSSSPMRNSPRSSSPLQSASPAGSSPNNVSPSRYWQRLDEAQQQKQPPHSLSQSQYKQTMARDLSGTRSPDARSIATEIPFDQAVDLSKGDTDALEPGRIHSAAAASRPPPSPSISRRNTEHPTPALVVPNVSPSPSNSTS